MAVKKPTIKKPNSEVVSFRLPPDLYKILEDHCDGKRNTETLMPLTVSGLARQLVVKAIPSLKKEKK